MIQVTLTKEQLELTIGCIKSTIQTISEWNFGDEYDCDITPFQDLLEYYREHEGETNG